MLSSSFRCDQIYKYKIYNFGHTLLCYLSQSQMFNKPTSGSSKEASKQKRGYFLENETKYASILSKVSKLCLLKIKSSGLTLLKLCSSEDTKMSTYIQPKKLQVHDKTFKNNLAYLTKKQRWVCSTTKWDLSSTTKCDPNHVCDN